MSIIVIVGIIALLGFGGLITVIVVKLLLPLMQGIQENNRVLQTGTPAQARILAVGYTGYRVNYNRQLLLTLEVHPPAGVPYTTQATLLPDLKRRNDYHVGYWVQIRIDPRAPTSVAVVKNAPVLPSGGPAVQ